MAGGGEPPGTPPPPPLGINTPGLAVNCLDLFPGSRGARRMCEAGRLCHPPSPRPLSLSCPPALRCPCPPTPAPPWPKAPVWGLDAPLSGPLMPPRLGGLLGVGSTCGLPGALGVLSREQGPLSPETPRGALMGWAGRGPGPPEHREGRSCLWRPRSLRPPRAAGISVLSSGYSPALGVPTLSPEAPALPSPPPPART